jgi:hypothetical protein
MHEIDQAGKMAASQLSFLVTERNNNDEIRGTYLYPCLVYHVTERANLRYDIQVAKRRDCINNKDLEA